MIGNSVGCLGSVELDVVCLGSRWPKPPIVGIGSFVQKRALNYYLAQKVPLAHDLLRQMACNRLIDIAV